MVPLWLKPKRMSTLSVVPTSCRSVTVRLFLLRVSSWTVVKLQLTCGNMENPAIHQIAGNIMANKTRNFRATVDKSACYRELALGNEMTLGVGTFGVIVLGYRINIAIGVVTGG
jgi:hypothetical protein